MNNVKCEVPCKINPILSTHLASVQKIWREKLKWVVGLDQPRRGKRLKVFVKELVNLGLAAVSDHRHVDERRSFKKVLFGLLQFHTVHEANIQKARNTVCKNLIYLC